MTKKGYERIVWKKHNEAATFGIIEIKITEKEHVAKMSGFLNLLLYLQTKIFNGRNHTAIDLLHFLLKWFNALHTADVIKVNKIQVNHV